MMYWVEKILGRMLMLSMVSQCQCPARAGHVPSIPSHNVKVRNERWRNEEKEEEEECRICANPSHLPCMR
jgi:hypothetical protein